MAFSLLIFSNFFVFKIPWHFLLWICRFANYFVLYDGNCHDFFFLFWVVVKIYSPMSIFRVWKLMAVLVNKAEKLFFFTTRKRKEISGCFLFIITSLFIHLFGLLGAGKVFRLGLLSFRTSGFARYPSHTERNIRSGVLPNRSSAPYRVLNLNIFFAIAILNWHDKF